MLCAAVSVRHVYRVTPASCCQLQTLTRHLSAWQQIYRQTDRQTDGYHIGAQGVHSIGRRKQDASWKKSRSGQSSGGKYIVDLNPPNVENLLPRDRF